MNSHQLDLLDELADIHERRLQAARTITPRAHLVAELIDSRDPVEVPIAFALEQIFDDVSIEDFCKMFNLRVEIVQHRIVHLSGLVCFGPAFYRFSFIA